MDQVDYERGQPDVRLLRDQALVPPQAEVDMIVAERDGGQPAPIVTWNAEAFLKSSAKSIASASPAPCCPAHGSAPSP